MILDCTFRDGGYYVDWDFEESTIRKYLAAVAIAKVDIIEIGFRFLPTDKFLGAFAYSTDKYLKTINLPKNIPIAVMINAAEIISNKGCHIKDTVNKLFVHKNRSLVDIVRVAIHAKDIDVDGLYEILNELKTLGYRVFVNLMQIDSASNSEIINISSLIESWNLVEVLYFADSLGSMDSRMIEQTVQSISTTWSGSIGIHAHDNKGLALSNTLKAQECGVEYLDSTLCGMGRGAGNAKTEYLLTEVMQLNGGLYFPDALFPLVLQEFKDLQKTHQWGENIYYFLSAVHGIHPTYIQEMLGGELYETEQILSAINFLRKSRVPFYSFEKMLTALIGVKGNSHGGWSATELLAKNKEVLILAPGPELKKHISALVEYIKIKKPVVLCLNINESVPEDVVTVYVTCNETRILIESDLYSKLNLPIILPLDRIPKSIKEILHNTKILDFGMSIDKNKFKIKSNGCILTNSLSLFYAISIATASNANRILIAGADGYEVNDSRHKEVDQIFKQYKSLDNSIPIYSVTSTTYSIKKRSIYDPSL